MSLSDHTFDVLSYDDYRFNYKPILHNLIKTLREILNVTNAEAIKMLIANPQLKKRSRVNILNNYHNLLEAGIEKDTIMENTWLLAHESSKLKEKLDSISKLKMNNDQLVPWLCLTQEELTNYVYYIQSDMDSYMCNKIKHLANRLECSVKQLCELSVRYPFLLKIPISYLDRKLDILHEYNVNNKCILRDLWVFRYTENHIRQRCELYKDANSLEVKTWAIRCPIRVISRAIKERNAKQSVMRHHKTIGDYLMDKLKIDQETLNRVITKTPNILRISLVKLNSLINMLQDNGITSDEILRYQHIFYFSVTTIQRRIKILNEVNLRPRLPLLACAEKVFKQYISNHRRKQEVLQHHQSVKYYLISKLGTDEEALESALKKYPNILRVNVVKIDEVINILQYHGITSDDILNNARIFFFKIKTLRKRIDTFKESGLPLKLSVFTYSQQQFDSYVELHRLKN
ncbi:transcription termination factor, mitochondrial isoform X2 [Ooceraea biroi]|nr:transcription termination factor, mitochondrial isoform X2 [Ooceraea biroi]